MARLLPNSDKIPDDFPCKGRGTHAYLYERGNGRKTMYCHYVDGMEIWEYNPGLWKGWKLMHKIDGETEVW